MYTMVMMMAMTTAPDMPDFGHRRRASCYGCYGGCYSSCYGCYGSCYGGYGGRRSCYGGCYGSCYGGYGSCYGRGYASCNGCYGASYFSCYGGCYGGCYGSSYASCYGGCYGGGCYGGGCYGSPYGMMYSGGGCYGGGCYGGSVAPGSVVPNYTVPGTVVPDTVVPGTQTAPSTTTPMGEGAMPPAGVGSSYGQRNAERATVVVRLPENAKLYANNQLTDLTSNERRFVTPKLQTNRTYAYDLRVEYTRDNQPVVENKQIIVRAGKQTEVEFGPTVRVAKVEATETAMDR